MDRLDAMRIFVAVAKLGSFAEAARQLRVSPSVATRSVAQLEDQLGLTLMTRTTRSLRLNDRGQMFLENCQQILEDIDSSEQRVRGGSSEPRGELKVAAPIVFGRLHVLRIANRLLAEHRSFSIRLVLSDRKVHFVDDNVDVAVRVGNLSDSRLIAVKLGEVSRVLVASPAYLKSRGVPKTPSKLQGHDIIAFEGIDTTDEWGFKQKENIRVSPRLTVNSADAAIAAAEAGIGIARTLSYQVKEAVAAGRLVLILQKFAPTAAPVSAVYPHRRIASVNVAAFVEASRKHFVAEPLLPVNEWEVAY
jgi:DNA-binding transcriptional LysR family regulator